MGKTWRNEKTDLERTDYRNKPNKSGDRSKRPNRQKTNKWDREENENGYGDRD